MRSLAAFGAAWAAVLAATAAPAVPNCPEPAAPTAVRVAMLPAEIVVARLQRVIDAPLDPAPRTDVVRELWRAAGCVDLAVQRASKHAVPGLICTLPGASQERVVIGSSLEGDGEASAALMPSLYESLEVAPRAHTLVFVSFAPKGNGELRFLASLAPETRAQLRAFVHVGPTGYGPLRIHPENPDLRLECLVRRAGASLGTPVAEEAVPPDEATLHADPNRYTPLYGRYVWPAFRARDLRIVGVHTGDPRQTMKHLDTKTYYANYRQLVAAIALIDGEVGAPAAAALSAEAAPATSPR